MCRQSASVCLIKSPSRQHRALPHLSQRLVTLADPRHRRGRRHSFVSVLLIACSAVLIRELRGRSECLTGAAGARSQPGSGR
jgi:hypothetical protein